MARDRPARGGGVRRGPLWGAQARGRDECFSTVLPCRHAAWGNLRDHGLHWGRPWVVLQHGATADCTHPEERFTFRRTLDLHGATLHAPSEVESHSEEPLPWMWSQHALLAARPGERIRPEGIRAVPAEGRPVSWPCHDGGDPSVVGAPEDRVAWKHYARAAGAVRGTLDGPEGGLAFAWDDPGIDAMGLWLDWGGRPEDTPVHQLDLEPTIATADDLRQAEAQANARSPAPGATADWRMTVALMDPS